MTLYRGAATAFGAAIVICTLAMGCLGPENNKDAGEILSANGTATADSAVASSFIEALQARFQADRLLGPAYANAFLSEGTFIRPRIPEAMSMGTLHRANVLLPARANGAFRLSDASSGMTVEIGLDGATDAWGETARGFVVYRQGHESGADRIYWPMADGAEDYLHFEHPPAKEELIYELVLGTRVAGIRFVADTVELVDAGGTPRLRMTPPFVVDADGVVHKASVEIVGCAYDQDPRAPWGRAVTQPGANKCGMRVIWAGQSVRYPALMDPAWSTTGSLAKERYGHTATLLANGKVLAVGGKGYGAAVSELGLDSAEIYDPATGTWSATGSLAAARHIHSASVLADGKVLIAGGHDGSTNGLAYLRSAEVYDPTTGTFGTTGNMGPLRGYHTANVLANGKVLVVGGRDGYGYHYHVELYDPAAGAWSNTGFLATSRRGHSASVLANGKVLVAGGYGGVSPGGSLWTAELYNPATGTWSQTGLLTTTSRYDHTASVLPTSGKVLVAGGRGFNGAPLDSAELYDPVAGTWSATGSMAYAHYRHTASVLASGNVLVVAGGFGPNDSDIGTTAALYDPIAGVWSAAGFITKRIDHAASVLPNGNVLVLGGHYHQNFTHYIVKTATLYSFSSLGAACTLANDCGSGYCVDGVCCANACGGGIANDCQACNAPGSLGTCSLLTGSDCSDGDACTQKDTCQAGVCTGANPVICQAPDTCHMAGVCDPSTGMCSSATTNPDGSACDDGNACTQSDTCQTGVCTGANPVVCMAQDECHLAGVCDAQNGMCSNLVLADGTPCSSGTCQNGVCTASIPDGGMGSSSSTGGAGGHAGTGGHDDGGVGNGGNGGNGGNDGGSAGNGGGSASSTSSSSGGGTGGTGASMGAGGTHAETGTGGGTSGEAPGCNCRVGGNANTDARSSAALLSFAFAVLSRKRRRRYTNITTN